MRVELKIDRRDKDSLPKNGIQLIENELKRRITARYADTEIIVRVASSNELNITRTQKETEKNVKKIVEEMFSESDEWLTIDS